MKEPLWKMLRRQGKTLASDLTIHELMPYQIQPPVDIFGIAKRLGIDIRISDDLFFVGALDTTGERPVILIGKFQTKFRKRFIVAHCIAHLLKDDLGKKIVETDFAGSAFEIECNKFAANTLMPFSMLDPAASVTNCDVKKLASWFQVSEAAMNLRILKMCGAA